MAAATPLAMTAANSIFFIGVPFFLCRVVRAVAGWPRFERCVGRLVVVLCRFDFLLLHDSNQASSSPTNVFDRFHL
jgi:hypothetical protein